MSRPVFTVFSILITLSFLTGSAFARPPRPGPNFEWVAPRTDEKGATIPGYWKYRGPEKAGKVWIPARRDKYGTRVPGHWKTLQPPSRDKKSEKARKWVPGRYGPGGRWIRGHWSK